MKTTGSSPAAKHHRRYGYAATLQTLVETDSQSVIGALTEHAAQRPTNALEALQVHAWRESLDWLKAAGSGLIAQPELGLPTVCLEFEIPRRGGRIDAVLLLRDLVFVIEFKATRADKEAQRQAEDYGLELLDFHEASAGRRILPIVCAKDAKLAIGKLNGSFVVAEVSCCRPEDLSSTVVALFELYHEPASERSELLLMQWLSAPYAPTPTIIEAARALYAGHGVSALSQSEASREHLERSFAAIKRTMDRAFQRHENTIIFLTGIPGAGKTLAGMNVVHHSPELIKAAFLSGNGPLVSVLQEVLAEDLAKRTNVTRAEGRRRTRTLVQNVHRWLDEYVEAQPSVEPLERVVVFDEAQRAWNREQSMRKFQRDQSEPEMMLEVMGRRSDGGVIVALVGGGQEINTGEAGLSEWGRALLDRFPDWRIAVSPQLLAGDPSTAGSCLFQNREQVPKERITEIADLHLQVSQRSFRSTSLTKLVEAVLAGDWRHAALQMEAMSQHYPIVLTRDLEVAREWLRKQSRGNRTRGILASSGARRLRQYGISVAERVKEVDWFLKPAEDVRSSDFLELALSEFGVQGLELDWACVAWGGDLTPQNDQWDLRRFRGTRWEAVHNEQARAYVLNRYRVLLTRAREGMVLWIPPGDPRDPSRDPKRFNAVEDFLRDCGVRSI